MKLPDPGIYQNIPDTVYHASPGISKHGLDLINKSPAHYMYSVNEDNPVFAFGRALHCLVLEPDVFFDQFVIAAFDDFRTKAAKDWKNAQEGKTIISVKDWGHIKNMAENIYEHDKAKHLLDNGKAEQSAYWIDDNTGCLCRCRPDFVNDTYRVAIDLKTTNCAGESAFMRDVVRYRYHVQAAFYMDGLAACDVHCDDFIFVSIEKTPPYAIACYNLDYDALEYGRVLYRENLNSYKYAYDNQIWPAYTNDIRTIRLPKYAYHPDYF